MGTISSSIGLISGMDIQNVVTQLMAIESRPLDLLKARIEETTKQRTAYSLIVARLMAAKSAISALAKPSVFTAKSATSSNDNVLSASATSATPTGAYSFTVRSLVSTHQLVSRGFRDRDSAPVGAGKLTFEVGKGNVAPSTSLSSLNGGTGVRRGIIRITDCNGDTADINLTGALTVDDVLDAINTQSDANIRASVDGNAIVITDLSEGSANLKVADLAGGYTAADLGLVGSDVTSTATEIRGRDIVSLTNSTRLAKLNDGIGVRFDDAAPDFQIIPADGGAVITVNLSKYIPADRNIALAQLNDGEGVRLGTIKITNRKGESAEIDLSEAKTLADVDAAIDAADIGVKIGSISGGKLQMSDSSEGEASNLIIEDVEGYAAADLGIVADTEESAFTGSVIYRMDTLGAVKAAIENAEFNDDGVGNKRVTVELDGNRLILTDNTSGTDPAEIVVLNDSLAAHDLGLLSSFDNAGKLETRDLIAGLNTVLLSSLNGGNGIPTGSMTFAWGTGVGESVTVHFTQEDQTLSDVIARINEEEHLSAEVDAGGTRIRITSDTGTLTVDAGGMADALGLSASGDGELVSNDLQLQYITQNTLLSDLNFGKGISNGKFTITNSEGTTRTVPLLVGADTTIGKVIDQINELGIGVVARINANGDGIELEDTTTGTGTLKVEQVGSGTTAADLGILGTADDNGILTGSFAGEIEIGGADSLDDLVEKINEAKLGVTASVINDGSGDAPYRLVLSSTMTGTQGKISFSSDIPGLDLETLTEARDASVVIGDPTSPNAVLVTSSSNTVEDIVPGLTLDLLGTSTGPVEVTVDRDVDTLVGNIQSFADAFNESLDTIDELTQYIPETEEKGILLGDATARQVQNRLYRGVSAMIKDPDSSLTSLASIGLTLASASLEHPAPRLQFDEAKFREAFENDPDAVKRLFTKVTVDGDGDKKKAVKVGLAARLEEMINSLTTTGNGLLKAQDERLLDKIDLYNRRAEDMQELLDMKEARLYAQFQAMEQALAGMQSQQSALANLASLAAASTTSASNGISLG